MTYANDRASTDLEYAEALDIMAQQRMAQVLLDRIDEILKTDPEFGSCDICGANGGMCIHTNVPAPAEDEQATNEGGGKAVPARPTLTGCDWLRGEGVLDELPN